jgi:hypothetical protein
MKTVFQIFGLIIFFIVAIAFLQAEEKTQNRGMGVDYDQLKVKSYKHWDVYLHENQCHLGRVFVQLKEDENAEDFLDIDVERRQ